MSSLVSNPVELEIPPPSPTVQKCSFKSVADFGGHEESKFNDATNDFEIMKLLLKRCLVFQKYILPQTLNSTVE